MTHITCEKCDNMVKIKTENDVHIKYHIVCNNCKKNLQLHNKTESKKIFFLNNNDLEDIKSLYSTNKTIMYIHEDLEEYAIKKHGDISVIEKKREKETLKKNKILKIKNENKKIREEIISQYFDNNKLELKPYGDCYSFINNGYPPLNEIAQNEIKKNEQKNKKYLELAKELSKLNIQLDDSCTICYEYINNIGCRNLRETVRMVELDNFLQTKTKYNKFVKKYGKDVSREFAIRQYMSSKNDDDDRTIINNIRGDVTIEFD